MKKQGSIKQDSKTGRFLVGRGAFAKISAVEGIRMPRGMRADFEEFDASDMPAERRRAVLADKYGKRKG